MNCQVFVLLSAPIVFMSLLKNIAKETFHLKRLSLKYKWQITVVIILGFVVTIFDAVGVGIFIPLVSFTEKNVMTRLKSEFSSKFAQWFAMLVSDVFEVSLNDEFTPVIYHQDYEIDYAYLSGGERTAVALAYRLSLNQIVNSLLSKIKTRDIVILDEPTDGFSEQQLDKMRDVLRQLEVKQLIIVSHEAKIESFVENVIKFKKETGISKVSAQNLISA